MPFDNNNNSEKMIIIINLFVRLSTIFQFCNRIMENGTQKMENIHLLIIYLIFSYDVNEIAYSI